MEHGGMSRRTVPGYLCLLPAYVVNLGQPENVNMQGLNPCCSNEEIK